MFRSKKNLAASGIRSKLRLSIFPLNSFLRSYVEAFLSQVPTMECKYVATNRFYGYCHCNSIGEGTVFSIATYIPTSRLFCDEPLAKLLRLSPFMRRNHEASDNAIDSTRRYLPIKSIKCVSGTRTYYRRFEVRFSLTSFIWNMMAM